MQTRTYKELYQLRYAQEKERSLQERESKRLKNAMEVASGAAGGGGSAERREAASLQSPGFDRIALCRRALEALDRRGWERSYHQRFFHDHFIRACARVFWKVLTTSVLHCSLCSNHPGHDGNSMLDIGDVEFNYLIQVCYRIYQDVAC